MNIEDAIDTLTDGDDLREMTRHNAADFVKAIAVIVEAARLVANLDAPLRALNVDMHQASTRPCSTCSDLTEVLGWPFGCAALTSGEAEQ
jgi:hypothetical protein